MKSWLHASLLRLITIRFHAGLLVLSDNPKAVSSNPIHEFITSLVSIPRLLSVHLKREIKSISLSKFLLQWLNVPLSAGLKIQSNLIISEKNMQVANGNRLNVDLTENN